MKLEVLSAVALLVPAATTAQVAAAPPVLTEGEEIVLARSAAPPTVSDDATVLVLRKGVYETAQEGSNGVTCMVSRSLPLAVEPICYDPEASRTILLIEIQRVEMRLAGASEEEVDRSVAQSIGTGELPLPSRPALAYMLSAGQILYADAETRVGSFLPHLHFYWPYATAEMFGALGGDPSAAVIISDPGKPTANLIVFAKDFVEPEKAAGPL
jgi:hypothetical protein